MDITNAEFVISNTDVRKCPAGTFPEYAFIGRSNVGKSSLINMLTGRKGLAMTSATPGKTMLINHFLINKSWYIVDLPGYGYAKRGQKGQEQIKRIIESYILQREQMTCLFVLIDSRLAPQAIDLELRNGWARTAYPCHRLHKGRQTERRQTEHPHQRIPGTVEGTVGRAASLLHHLF